MANDKDDAALDVDNTGEADVLTVHSGQDLLTRKTSLFLKTVNPQRFGKKTNKFLSFLVPHPPIDLLSYLLHIFSYLILSYLVLSS